MYRERATRKRCEGRAIEDAAKPPTTGGGNLKALAAAVGALAVCHDGAGFDQLDAPLGSALAAAPVEWTPWQARAAWKMLGKYRHQLADSGIDYSALSEPPVPEAGEREPNWAGVKDGDFVVGFGRLAPGLVAGVQRIPGGRFDAATRTAVIPASLAAVEPLLAFIARNGFDFSPTVVERAWEVAREQEERAEASRAADADLEVEGLGGETCSPKAR